jgi:NadR type nicotinamide-nucleotide adenylyltransferase
MQALDALPGTGLIIGKFMPPHKGHQHLIEFARARVADLTVLLLSRSTDAIPGELRHGWLQALFPYAKVAHLRHELPMDYGNVEVWNQWIALIRQACPDGPDLVFSSESYGEELARRLGARHMSVDPERTVIPVTATLIRQQPFKYKSYVPDCVWPYFEKQGQKGTFEINRTEQGPTDDRGRVSGSS